MFRSLFIALLIFSTQFSNGQTQEDFDALGKVLLNQLTDYNHTEIIYYARIREFHEIIDRQPLGKDQKSLMKHKVNETYKDTYTKFQKSMQELAANYRIDIEQGATFEYDQTRYEQLEGTVDSYSLETSFLYKNGKTQTIVRFYYDVAWLDNARGFVMLGAVVEKF